MRLNGYDALIKSHIPIKFAGHIYQGNGYIMVLIVARS